MIDSERGTTGQIFHCQIKKDIRLSFLILNHVHVNLLLYANAIEISMQSVPVNYNQQSKTSLNCALSKFKKKE